MVKLIAVCSNYANAPEVTYTKPSYIICIKGGFGPYLYLNGHKKYIVESF